MCQDDLHTLHILVAQYSNGMKQSIHGFSPVASTAVIARAAIFASILIIVQCGQVTDCGHTDTLRLLIGVTGQALVVLWWHVIELVLPLFILV